MAGTRLEFSFGYSRHHAEVWFHRVWRCGQDSMHEYFWCGTLGMDGVR